MLTNSERAQIEEEFASWLAEQANPRSLVMVIFKSEADRILTPIPSGAPATEIAHWAVDSCLLSRWTLTPSLLEMLLKRLIDNRGVGALDAVLSRVTAGIDPNQSVYDEAWLGQHPFFDRRDFRRRVQCLTENNDWAILRVVAAAESFGRTYSRYFLQHLEDRLPAACRVVSVELSVGTGPSYQVLDLLEDVAAQLGAEDPIPSRMGSSYPSLAALWMLKQMMKRSGRWVVLLDGFGQKELNSEVRETIGELAAKVPIGQYRRRIRLVLLDYPQPLPRVGSGDMLQEILPSAAEIVQADLEPCLEAWNAERKQQGKDMTAEDLAKLANGMLKQAPQAGKERLEMLNTELSKLRQLE